MNNYSINTAKEEDVLNIINLIYSTETTPEYEWGMGSESQQKERLHDLILSPKNRFCLDNILVLKSNDKFAGMVLSIGGKKIKSETLKSDFKLINKQNSLKEKFLFFVFTLSYIPYKECLRSEYYISNIALLNEYRGCGFAEILLDKCYENAKKLGYNTVALNANNEKLIKYYETLGFTLVNSKNNKMIKSI